MFRVLSHWRRRYAVYYLNEADDAVVTLDEVADQLVEWERTWNGQGDDDAETHHETVRSTLHHNHLPKLADGGLIEYDARSQTVRFRRIPSIEHLLKQQSNELTHLKALCDEMPDEAGT